MIDYSLQPLAWSPVPQRPNVNNLWAPRVGGLLELQQKILGHSQEIMNLSRQLQAHQLQTGCTISRGIPDNASSRAPPPPQAGGDLIDRQRQIIDYSQQIGGLLRAGQSQAMQIEQCLPSTPPRDMLPLYLAAQGMSNSPFLHAMSQNFSGAAAAATAAPGLYRAPGISDPSQLPQQIMSYSQQIADLSRQLRVSQSQIIQINQDLTPMPLHQSFQNLVGSPFPYPVPQNVLYSDPQFHSGQSPYPFCPTPGNNSGYYCPATGIPSPPLSALGFTPRQWTGSLPSPTNGFPPPPVSAPLAPPTQSSTGVPIPGYHQYGDCGESLPLAVMTNLFRLTGRAEVRSVSAFTTRLRDMAYILEDGPIMAPVRIRDPCLNCEDLMQRLPRSVGMLAASGWSHDICWVTVNRPAGAPAVRYGFETPYSVSGKCEFSLSAAYGAVREEIYSTLEMCALANGNPFIFSADVNRYLAELWHGFIVPYRDNGSIFRLDKDDNVKPIMLKINGITVPICTVFCAIGYILSTVLWPDRVAVQRESCYLPLMSILAKWCHTLCPWAHPNVISVAYVTSPEPELDTLFLLGTSKPSAKAGAPPDYVPSKHTAQMRSIRKVFLEGHFGKLQNPCPVKVAADNRG